MRRAILTVFGLFGIIKGIGLAAAPEWMVQITPLTEPGARGALCLFTAIAGALIVYAAPAARAPRLVRALGIYGVAYGLLSGLVPSEAWSVYVAFVHAMMLGQSAMAGVSSIVLAVALLWMEKPRPPALTDALAVS